MRVSGVSKEPNSKVNTGTVKFGSHGAFAVILALLRPWFLLLGSARTMMNPEKAFKRLPAFTTERLLVRPLRRTDARAMFAIKSDLRVTEPYGTEPQKSLRETKRWVEQRLADNRRHDSMMWAISPRGEGDAIGSCCFWHFDFGSKSAEVGYELDPSHWHRGLTTEALTPVLAYGFDGLGLHRIEAALLPRMGLPINSFSNWASSTRGRSASVSSSGAASSTSTTTACSKES